MDFDGRAIVPRVVHRGTTQVKAPSGTVEWVSACDVVSEVYGVTGCKVLQLAVHLGAGVVRAGERTGGAALMKRRSAALAVNGVASGTMPLWLVGEVTRHADLLAL